MCRAVFAPAEDRKKMGVTVNAPFTKWPRKSDVMGEHQMKPSHRATQPGEGRDVPAVTVLFVTFQVLLSCRTNFFIQPTDVMVTSAEEPQSQQQVTVGTAS